MPLLCPLPEFIDISYYDFHKPFPFILQAPCFNCDFNYEQILINYLSNYKELNES